MTDSMAMLEFPDTMMQISNYYSASSLNYSQSMRFGKNEGAPSLDELKAVLRDSTISSATWLYLQQLADETRPPDYAKLVHRHVFKQRLSERVSGLRGDVAEYLVDRLSGKGVFVNNVSNGRSKIAFKTGNRAWGSTVHAKKACKTHRRGRLVQM